MKTKKILLISLASLLTLFVATEIFFIYKCKGNLDFVICNESSSQGANSMEIYVDGKKIIEDKIDLFYSFYTLKTSLGNHTIMIKIDEYESEEIRVNTILFTSIYIDYFVDQLNNDKHHFHFHIQKHPFYQLAWQATVSVAPKLS